MTISVRTRAIAISGALAILYGLVAYRFGTGPRWLAGVFSAMTVGFMALVPFAIGYLTVFRMDRPRIWVRIFAPWAVFAVILSICYLAGWEGTVCVVLALPWLLLFASLGGLVAGFVSESRRAGAGALVAIAPLIIIPIERRIPAAAEMHQAVAEVVIAAPQHDVWEYVVSVDTIRAGERARALFTTIGFPAPVAATLDHPRVGGVRRASFAGNVVFTEKITDWLDAERLRFTIAPNTAEIPTTTLDPHVTVGGDYFDVLTGTYELEPVGDTATRLILRSEYRVSTHFNPYSGWWADHIMASVQRDILRVLKARAEHAARARTPMLTADMRELERPLLEHARASMMGGRETMLVDETMILHPDGEPESLGGVSIPGGMTAAWVEESMRSVIGASAARARVSAWMTNFGGAGLRYEFEDRLGRCVTVSRTVSADSTGAPVFGMRELARCETRALAAVIARGRRLAAIPFHDKGLDVIFSTVGDYPGTVEVYFDSVVVTVRGAILKTKLLTPGVQHVDSVTASLAYHSGTNSWGPGKPSNAVRMHWPAVEGEQRAFPRFRFTIPRDSSEMLSDRWVVFTHHLTVPKTEGNPYGLAWTYAHLSETMFRGISGARD